MIETILRAAIAIAATVMMIDAVIGLRRMAK